jgi:hypothetical protein
MKNDWILDVLSDLKCFAQRNGHDLLAQQLSQARQIAVVEIASAEIGGSLASHGDEATVGANPGGFGASYQS